MQEVPDTIANSFSYQDRRRDALREYLFNLNYQQCLSDQLAEVQSKLAHIEMKFLNLQNSLLQDIPKVLKKQNQQRIGECLQQFNSIRKQQNALQCQLEQQINKWKGIHQRCNNLKYRQEQPFSFYYNSSVHCEYQPTIQAEFLCTNKKCRQHSAFICHFSQCKCQKDHKICAMVPSIPFIQVIIEKLNRNAKRQLLQYFQAKQIIYQQMLDRVSKERDLVDQWYDDQTNSQTINQGQTKKLILYGLDHFGKSVYCQQVKVYYGSLDNQLHQNCACVPLIVKKDLFEIDKTKAKQLYSSIITLYADLIEQLQQKRSKIENQKRNLGLNKAESMLIARLMQESSLFGIGIPRSQEKPITGQLVYYCRTHSTDLIEQNLLQKLNKASLRSKWINKVQSEFRKSIQGSCLNKTALFDTQFPFRQIQKEQILQSIQDIYLYLNEEVQVQARIQKHQQILIDNLKSLLCDQMKQRHIVRVQNQGMFQQVINLQTKKTKKLYLKGQLPFQIQHEIIVKKRKQEIRQIYIQLSQLFLNRFLAKTLSKYFPELQIFQNFAQKSLFNRQLHQYGQFNFQKLNQLQVLALEKPMINLFYQSQHFLEPVWILETLKRFKKIKIFTQKSVDNSTAKDMFYPGILQFISYRQSLTELQVLSYKCYRAIIQSRFAKNQLDGFNNILSLSIQNYQLNSLTLLNFFKRNTKIKSIDFRACNYIYSNLTNSILQNCLLVQSFSISGLKNIVIQGDVVQLTNILIPILQIKTLKSLSVKALKQNQINQKSLYKSLTNIEYFQMHDRSLYQVQKLLTLLSKNASNLKYIDIRNNCITSNQFRCLKNSRNLQTLLCGGRNHINGLDIICVVKYCKKIRKLSITDLNGQPQLLFCMLDPRQYKNGEVSSKDLISINQNAKLTHLNIKNCKIQSYCLKELTNIKVLRISPELYQSQQVQYLIQKGVKIVL